MNPLSPLPLQVSLSLYHNASVERDLFLAPACRSIQRMLFPDSCGKPEDRRDKKAMPWSIRVAGRSSSVCAKPGDALAVRFESIGC